MLNLSRLTLLVEFQRRGTLLDVSRALSFSPSTVSQQMKVLEREVGARLLDRTGRKLRLTREGELLANRAVVILAEMESAESELASARVRARGTVRMAAFQTLALAALPRTLDRLAIAEPELTVVMRHIDPHDALDALIAGEFDVIVGEEYPGRPVVRHRGVEMQTLLEDPMLLVVHKGVRSELDPVAAATSMPWVTAPLPANGRQWMVATCRDMGVEPRIQFESDDLMVHLRLAETGHAVAALPQLLLDSERPAVRTFHFPGHPTRRVFVAIRSASKHSPAVKSLVEALAQSVVPLAG